MTPTTLRPHLKTPVRRNHIARCALALGCLSAVVAAAGSTGCSKKDKGPNTLDTLPSRYPDLGAKKGVPDYMKGSVFQFVELANADAYPVSSYGLVGRLRGTGDSTAPSAVREWMIREMTRRGFGNRQIPGYGNIGAGDVLNSPDFAIVEVHALIPPGARQGDWIDAHVRALPRSRTTNLSHGVLYETDLKLRGADPQRPGVAVNVLARAKGPIVVNPAYALASPGEQQRSTTAKSSLRNGVIMLNTRVMSDYALRLQLRQPQRSIARTIERRINEHFQHVADHPRASGGGYNVAEAQDEGIVELYVPRSFKGDWERFTGVATHLFLNTSVAFTANKAKELAAQALQPDAPLMNISYAWEGLGAGALPFLAPLMSNNRPDVAFAAARAAAFIGDPTGGANQTLLRIAATANHPFQVSAIRVLGAMPTSTATNHMLRGLLNSRQATVRVEAYKVLVANADSSVFTRWIKDPWLVRADGQHEDKFALDIVPSDAPPMVYATRQGAPRIAVIGKMPTIALPAIFTAMEQRFMITSRPNERAVTLFFRDERYMRDPLRMMSKPDIAEIVARLGGEGAVEERRFDFTYGEILAVLQQMVNERKLEVVQPGGRLTLATFMMQDPPSMRHELENVPVIGEPARPQADDGSRPTGGGDAIPRIGAADPAPIAPGAGGRPQ